MPMKRAHTFGQGKRLGFQPKPRYLLLMTERAPFRIPGRTGEWEVVLGLEVHAQVASNSKLFSAAGVGFGAGPNEQVSLVDAAFPGMLPVINRYCVEQAVKTGLGLKAQINLKSRFDRKNYFYPDLPAGYQISQFKDPVVGEGELEVERDDGTTFRVGIERLHLEQDAGKSIHDLDPNATYVDLNRAGTALMEIVSKPDMRSPEDAAAYVKTLRMLVRYLGTCDGDMEKGNLRADVNVSVRKPGGPLGTRCEIKNVNSMRYIQQAIVYEARRQVEILEDGGKIDQETRLFDAGKGETRSMRSKEEAHDYRYFPDPDLLPLELDPAWVKAIEASLPELPDDKRARLISQYDLSPYDARVLVSDAGRAALYERLVETHDPKLTANTVTQSVLSFANANNAEITADGVLHLTAEALSAYLTLVENQTVSSKTAKELFEGMVAGEGTPAEIVEARGLRQVTDTGAIEAAVDKIIAANPDKVEAAKAKPQAVGWFVGQVMKETGGKANPAAVNEILKAKLGL
jgi:aspartyl-tRNA(Asn)/glutamyl-tRNA(Gln) amidotransferase subunit B